MRPNKQRRKTTVYLSAEDQTALRTLRAAIGSKTSAGAIRYAVQTLARRYSEPRAFKPAESIAYRYQCWANQLNFLSDAEIQERRAIDKDADEILSITRP